MSLYYRLLCETKGLIRRIVTQMLLRGLLTSSLRTAHKFRSPSTLARNLVSLKMDSCYDENSSSFATARSFPIDLPISCLLEPTTLPRTVTRTTNPRASLAPARLRWRHRLLLRRHNPGHTIGHPIARFPV